MKAIKISLICLIVLLLTFPSFAATSLKGLSGAYTYLCNQVKGIGIIDSYKDAYSDSYTYDNALAVMAFTAKGDYTRAKTTLNAYQNKIGLPLAGGYYDVYNYTTGVGRGNISAGPNAWLLQAINLYYYKSGDAQFAATAQALADFLVGLQDIDGGLFGDDFVSWKSTEHNLVAYAALYNYGMLNNKDFYIQKSNLVKDFLALNCWNGERFLRGVNDPLEVTDTQSLGVLALGTTYASAIYWAEYHTKCTKPLGRLSVTGFDFNNDLDTVWMEGTLQEAMAFKKNYDDYRAGIYFGNVDKTQRTSGGFLCATNKGTTGTDWILLSIEAVAPTSWYILYSTNTNPLMR